MNSPLIPSPNRLGDALRTLMERRDLTGLALADRIGISPTSISRIINGVSRPRQGTLTKLMEALCSTPEEQQLVLSGYSGLPDAIGEEPAVTAPIGQISAAELDRVARYLELKTLSIDFRESVSRTLIEAGIEFESYARNGNVVTDFLVETSGRTAVECKFNVNRDWEREVGTALLLKRHLPCGRVVVVVPYENEISNSYREALASIDAEITTITALLKALR
jgi:transcriptional regulator with XRE-family HTH domain